MVKLNGKIVLLISVVTVASIALALALDWLKLPAAKPLSKPIGYVRITGAFQQLAKDELKDALLPLVSSGFFATDMKAVQQAVVELPWVKSVSVRRVWPDTIDIKVEEKVPVVRWGNDSLMTAEGVLFSPKNVDGFGHLVKLDGPVRLRLKLLEIMKGVNTALADRALALAEFHANERESWTIKLTTGPVILLGRDGQLEKLQRFLRTLPLLQQEQVAAMALVDLRYPNGYAVAWKPDTPEFDWANIANPNPNAAGKKQ